MFSNAHAFNQDISDVAFLHWFAMHLRVHARSKFVLQPLACVLHVHTSGVKLTQCMM